MTEWYEVDMNNSRCYATHKKKMIEDLAEMYVELYLKKKKKNPKKPKK